MSGPDRVPRFLTDRHYALLRWGSVRELKRLDYLCNCPPARVSLLTSPTDRASVASRLQGEKRAEGPEVSGCERSPYIDKGNDSDVAGTVMCAGIRDEGPPTQVSKLMLSRLKGQGLVKNTGKQPRSVA